MTIPTLDPDQALRASLPDAPRPQAHVDGGLEHSASNHVRQRGNGTDTLGRGDRIGQTLPRNRPTTDVRDSLPDRGTPREPFTAQQRVEAP